MVAMPMPGHAQMQSCGHEKAVQSTCVVQAFKDVTVQNSTAEFTNYSPWVKSYLLSFLNILDTQRNVLSITFESGLHAGKKRAYLEHYQTVVLRC